MKVLIVGNGFAGNLHAAAWRELGHEVEFYDIIPLKSNYPTFGNALLNGSPDVLDFCDTPKSRIETLSEFAKPYTREKLEDKIIYVEKPVCRPGDIDKYIELSKELNITPIHNYLFMPFVNSLESNLTVSILRNGVHKGWYSNAEKSGGGILLDHGYHWLYIANLLGTDLDSINGWVDGIPDMTCALSGNGFKFYATWRSPIRLTVVDGVIREPRERRIMIDSFKALFDGQAQELGVNLLSQSIEIMEMINRVYRPHTINARSA